ncbi:hypothetical protein JTE90_009269 [Oedothorax gibbosus]|uniref:Uncharacterized protein n=1 Tax=Oedothorax gibbosus TaxID=931172 RepID=A0AAV6V277_9ARAC|nr:hypothetical protein JTE90_009269 [Oedothorax gibbosus]
MLSCGLSAITVYIRKTICGKYKYSPGVRSSVSHQLASHLSISRPYTASSPQSTPCSLLTRQSLYGVSLAVKDYMIHKCDALCNNKIHVSR